MSSHLLDTTLVTIKVKIKVTIKEPVGISSTSKACLL
jgi:hypothetical protein